MSSVSDRSRTCQSLDLLSAGFLKNLFPLPLPAPKKSKERVAGVARPRHTGNTLFTNLGWGACRQSKRLVRSPVVLWTFGEKACHPSLRSGSGEPAAEILRCAQDDSQGPAQVRSREVLSPNACLLSIFSSTTSASPVPGFSSSVSAFSSPPVTSAFGPCSGFCGMP